MFYKKALLKNFSIFTGKYLRWNIFLNKVATLQACNFIKRDSNTGVSCEYFEIFKNTYFEKHLRTTASALMNYENLRVKSLIIH